MKLVVSYAKILCSVIGIIVLSACSNSASNKPVRTGNFDFGVYTELAEAYKSGGRDEFYKQLDSSIKSMRKLYEPGDTSIENLAWDISGSTTNHAIQKEHELASELQLLLNRIKEKPAETAKLFEKFSAKVLSYSSGSSGIWAGTDYYDFVKLYAMVLNQPCPLATVSGSAVLIRYKELGNNKQWTNLIGKPAYSWGKPKTMSPVTVVIVAYKNVDDLKALQADFMSSNQRLNDIEIEYRFVDAYDILRLLNMSLDDITNPEGEYYKQLSISKKTTFKFYRIIFIKRV